MRSDQPRFFFTFLDREYFEVIDHYRPTDELISLVRGMAGEGWRIKPGAFWTNCAPESYQYQVQGWKIHVSSNVGTAVELLQRIVPLLIEEGVPFKFCSDLRMVALGTSKNWPRTGSGKFITIYPADLEQFKSLIERCYEATKGFAGPYLLTDRPYKDSRVIYYRYGEHTGIQKINSHGMPLHYILSPDGEPYSDERVPFFRLPPWVTDPFGASSMPSSNGGEVWLNNRYRVTGAVRYSSFGGLYAGEDTQTGQTVIIREARPMYSAEHDWGNAVGLLEKEARILQKLGPLGLTPRFVDMFKEWEHWFLVQEKLDAESLWGYTMNITFGAAERTSQELLDGFLETVRVLVEGLKVVHENNVVLRDFTKSNVMFTKEHQVKFIDFELAYETDRDDPPIAGWTEGYASPEQLSNSVPTPEEDYYALGSLILDMINVTASGLPLNRKGVLAGLNQVLEDFGLPLVFSDIVAGLTHPNPSERWRPEHALKALEGARVEDPHRLIDLPPGDAPPERPAPTPEFKAELQETIDGVNDYILKKIEPERDDRLWPASAEVFISGPISFQYGATGIAYYLWLTTGRVPDGVVDWILARAKPERCSPGLYAGVAGVALFLLEIGMVERAKELLAASRDWDRVLETPSLYDGAAGWGLTNLHFWRATGEQRYLDDALEVGEHLLRTATEDPEGLCWESDNIKPVGFGFGPSGIATFLLYLNAARPRGEYLSAVEKALDFEQSTGEWVSHRFLLYTHKEASVSSPKSPSMRHGTGGLGSAALRFYSVTGEPRYRKLADVVAYACSSRYTNKLWQDYGPAGWGEFLLDMYWFTGDENYLNNAAHLAGHILPHRIERPEGIAFAGAELLRISCDFGAGSAGIGYFFHRILHPRLPRVLLLDELLVERPAEASRISLEERGVAVLAA
ncbi:MAG TPA: class III lanthionine synthetase LanKC [Pyrinomonadaceae bacterium]|jgi:serine/threonine protein kinase